MLTRAEYHNNGYSHEKTCTCTCTGVKHPGGWCNRAVIIPVDYNSKNDLVAGKQRVKKKQYMQNQVK